MFLPPASLPQDTKQVTTGEPMQEARLFEKTYNLSGRLLLMNLLLDGSNLHLEPLTGAGHGSDGCISRTIEKGPGYHPRSSPSPLQQHIRDSA